MPSLTTISVDGMRGKSSVVQVHDDDNDGDDQHGVKDSVSSGGYN